MKCARDITRHVSVSVKIAQWFLGLTLDSKLNHYTHIANVTQKATAALNTYSMQKSGGPMWGLSPEACECMNSGQTHTVIQCNNLNKTLKSPGSSSQNNGGSISMYTFQLTESPDSNPTHWLLSQKRSSQGQGAARLHGTVEQFFHILA